MLKLIYRLIVLALAVTCSITGGATEKFSKVEALGRWITYYYMNPEPQLVGEAIHAASSQGFIKEGKKAAPFIGFVAGVVDDASSDFLATLIGDAHHIATIEYAFHFNNARREQTGLRGESGVTASRRY